MFLGASELPTSQILVSLQKIRLSPVFQADEQIQHLSCTGSERMIEKRPETTICDRLVPK